MSRRSESQVADLPPGDYWLTSHGDGKGRAILANDGRFLVEQFPGGDGSAYWADLTDIYRSEWRALWKIEPREETR